MAHPRPMPAPGGPRSRATQAPVSLDVVAGLLRDLDREQRRAVTHGEGPLLVLAGPGSGKTRVVTRRIAWLIATKRARPEEILALTFTEKAADEMQARVDRLVPYGQAGTAIHTFHAFGDRLVRDHAFELGLPGEPRVVGRAEATVLLRHHLAELGLRRYRPLADPTRLLGALVDVFSRAKDEDVDPPAYGAHADALVETATVALARAAGAAARDAAEALLEHAERQAEIARAYAAYERLTAAAGVIDHGDQLTMALRLLRAHPEVREELRARYRYLLVDEFQDTNPAQIEVVCALAGARQSVTVVGDDDQAIYAFRGAAVQNLLGFGARFPGARTVVLRRNHRSRASILQAAQRLIRHNDPYRLGARVGLDAVPRPARRARPWPVVARAFAEVGDEADWVAAEVAARVGRGVRRRDIAVLVRTNADADPVLRSLNMAGIPWRFSGASGRYLSPEVRELRAFLRVTADLEASVDLYALATGEPYRMGGTDLTAILERARRAHRSLWATLEELVEQPGLLRLEGATRAAATRLVSDLRASSELAHRRPAGEVLYDHLRRSGRLARLIEAGPAGEDALADVARFFAAVRSAASLLPDDRVAVVAGHLEALLEAGEATPAPVDDDADAVSVLTVHKAKGLEFSVVFVVGLAEGRFPGRGRREAIELPAELRRSAAGEDPEALHAEERRLCYVAMTRARDELLLSYAVRGEHGRDRRPSPFLAEALDASLEPIPAVAGSTFARAVGPPPRAERDVARSGGKPIALSFSKLDAYLTCPRQYHLRHVVRVPEPPHHALVYGRALHQAVAAFNLGRMRGTSPEDDAVLAVFAAHWSSEGFLSREHEEARFAAGQAALRRFRQRELDGGAGIAAGVEERFSFAFEGERIDGRFDRLDETAEGTVITDYKSGDVRDVATARQRARQSLQLGLYALAHEARSGQLPVAVALHFLDSGVVGRVRVEPRRLDATRQRIRRAAAGIRRRDFAPRPDVMACGYCPFRRICPDAVV